MNSNDQVFLRHFVDIKNIIIKPELQPCKTQDAEFIKELKASIEQRYTELGEEVALFSPVLITKTDEGLVLVDGETRINILKELGAEKVWVVDSSASVESVFTLRLVEKLKHGKLHPLDESDAYARMIEQGMTAFEIHREVSKPLKHISQTLQLRNLIDDARKEFYEGRLNLELAAELCKYTAKVQALALKQCSEKVWGAGYDGTGRDGVPVALPKLQGWLRSNVLVNLKDHSFPKNDETLVENAGSCTKCEKRSGNNADLFGEIPDGDICTDNTCLARKVAAYMKRQREKAASMAGDKEVVEISTDGWSNKKNIVSAGNWEKAEKGDKNAVVAIVTEGDGVGKVMHVKVKKAEERKAEPEKSKEQIEKEQKAAKLAELYHHNLLLAVIAKSPKKLTDKKDLLMIAGTVRDMYGYDEEMIEETFKCNLTKLETLSVGQLSQVIFAMVVQYSMGMSTKSIEELAKRLKIDAKKVKEATKKEMEAEEKNALAPGKR